MGIPRSQLYAKALEEFIEHHRRENITERLNRVYSKDAPNEFEDIANAGLESLRNLTREDSVLVTSQIHAVDRERLTEKISRIEQRLRGEVEAGMMTVLGRRKFG